ncbi:MAG TPA: hemerythrin domain-containing protein [Sphingomonas sp.]|nr:hemerythrin domain-containing protein [Sphingomonas sp.]
MSSIEAIREEHRALEARAAQLLRIVSSPVPDPAAVAAVRWGMVQALSDHCSREDHQVYAALLASDDPAAVVTAREFRREHGELERRFSDFVARWPLGRIAREWEIFRSDTAELVLALKRRIADEEAELYPLFKRLADRRVAA